ncbi:MAG: hypothetical protein ACC612_06505 [Methanomethylovorans sp.]|uniref:hypothetical protein n=1 Tax=Methanomethylovorans sp. TaxID=2758717 RepID=UPI003530AFA6
MKRLTISMSDALFDKLNQVENKSLFIRKLIEGELLKGITSSSDSTYESLAGDIEDLQHEIQSISSRLVSIEHKFSGVQLQSTGTSNHESLNASPITSPAFMPAENVVEVSSTPASLNASVNSAICTEVPGNANEVNVAAFSDVADIQVNLFGQDTDKVLPVHGDEVHNAPFRSVVNVGIQEEQVAGLADAIEKYTSSTVIASDAAIQSKECLSSSVNYPSPSFVMPELSEVSTPATSPFTVASPEVPAVSTPSFVMPELSEVSTPATSPFTVASPEVPAVSTPSFVMPELSEVSTPATSPFTVASPEVPAVSTPSFVMPELSEAGGHSAPSPFEMLPAMSVPSTDNDMQMPSFAATNLSAEGIQMQPPSFVQKEVHPQFPFGSATPQSQVQNNDSSRVNTNNMSQNERLQGNILMYLPHGARIKRSIIKGLVSKKFTAEEIDAQINLMISNRSLLVEVEDGVEYLLRP